MKEQKKTESLPVEDGPKSWRYHLGMVLFVASFPLFYATLIIVPFLPLPGGKKAVVMAVLLGFFYGIWFLSLPLLGREGFEALKEKYYGWWKLWNGSGKKSR